MEENLTQLTNISLAEEVKQLQDGLKVLQDNADDFFLAVMGSLVILMQAGFGFLEAGSVRAKNTTNILIKNYADLCFGGLAFWLVGYAFAFGEGTSFIGFTHFAAFGLSFSSYTYLFFQSTFAATCATIVSGAIAERCNFNGYIFFSIIVTGLTYPVATHWCWSPNGWLAVQGFHDFAGSAVVHLAGGTCAFIGAFILGPRIDRFLDKKSTYISGHSIPHVSLGGFILIFGFMAFNGGSQTSISQPGDGAIVGTAIISTLVACGTSGIVVLLIWKVHPSGDGKWSLGKIINGCLAGMVSVCAGCDGYYPWAAALVSAIAGGVYITISLLLVKLKIDDPLDAVAVHAGAGLWGILATPIFRKDGILVTWSEESFQMLMWNAIGALCIITWNTVTSTILFVSLDKADLFRVPAAAELAGLDIIKHNEPAYGFGTLNYQHI